MEFKKKEKWHPHFWFIEQICDQMFCLMILLIDFVFFDDHRPRFDILIYDSVLTTLLKELQ